MKKKWFIGTRGSPLALAQAQIVQRSLQEHWGDQWEFELKIVKTTGDLLQQEQISFVDSSKLEKGLFIKGLEEELLGGTIDLAVHSCKDLPIDLDPAFRIAAIPLRASVHDILIVKEIAFLQEPLPSKALVLTGSPRRKLQWLRMQPHTIVEPVRGNVDTRLNKLRQNSAVTAILLAEAGLERLQPALEGLYVRRLSMEEMLPAPGQGALAVQCRKDDEEVLNIVAVLNDFSSEYQIRAEREFLRAMGGGCLAPIAAYAEPKKANEVNQLCLHGLYFDLDHGLYQRRFLTGSIKRPSCCKELAEKLACQFGK